MLLHRKKVNQTSRSLPIILFTLSESWQNIYQAAKHLRKYFGAIAEYPATHLHVSEAFEERGV